MSTRFYVLANLALVCLAIAGMVFTFPVALAQGQSVNTTLDRVIHQVQHHKVGELAPEIGFVYDQENSVVCYFPKRLHWFDAQPNISCVFLGYNMLVDDKDVL